MTQFRAGEATVRLSMDDRGVATGVARFRKSMQNVGRNARRFAGIAGLAIGGLAAVTLKLASDAEETASKFDVVFGPAAVRASSVLDAFAEKVGRSKNELRTMASDLGALIGPMGFNAEATADMSLALTKLASDLASFHNVAENDALTALRAGLVGEAEPLRRMGVQLNQAAIEAEALARGLIRHKREMTPAIKATAVFNLIMKETVQAQGDAHRTSGSFANQLRRLTGSIKDTGVAIGQALLPSMTGLLVKMNDVMPSLQRWAELNSTGIRNTVAMAAGVTALAAAFGILLPILGMVAAHPVVAMLVAIGAALAVLVLHLTDAEVAGLKFNDILGRIVLSLSDYQNALLRIQDATDNTIDAQRRLTLAEGQLARADTPEKKIAGLQRVKAAMEAVIASRRTEAEVTKSAAEAELKKERAISSKLRKNITASPLELNQLDQTELDRSQSRQQTLIDKLASIAEGSPFAKAVNNLVEKQKVIAALLDMAQKEQVKASLKSQKVLPPEQSKLPSLPSTPPPKPLKRRDEVEPEPEAEKKKKEAKKEDIDKGFQAQILSGAAAMFNRIQTGAASRGPQQKVDEANKKANEAAVKQQTKIIIILESDKKTNEATAKNIETIKDNLPTPIFT